MAKAGSMAESLRRGGDGLVSNQHGVHWSRVRRKWQRQGEPQVTANKGRHSAPVKTDAGCV